MNTEQISGVNTTSGNFPQKNKLIIWLTIGIIAVITFLIIFYIKKINHKDNNIPIAPYLSGDKEQNTGQNTQQNTGQTNAPKSFILYEGPIRDSINSDMTEGTVEYNGKQYSFVRGTGIQESFKNMGVVVRDFDNRIDATVYLKQIFSGYSEQYSGAFNIENRNIEDGNTIDRSLLYPLIHQWAVDNNIPYAGLYGDESGFGFADIVLYTYIPVRINKRFIYIWSNNTSSGAAFGEGGGMEEFAGILSVGFGNMSGTNNGILRKCMSGSSGEVADAKIYEGSIRDSISSDMTEGTVEYNGKQYSFVRGTGVQESFKNMGVTVYNVDNDDDATIYLKWLFSDYSKQYPEIFKLNSRSNLDDSILYPLISQRALDNNIPYAGRQKSEGYRDGVCSSFEFWIPVRVDDDFLHIWLMSYRGNFWANISDGDMETARLSIAKPIK